VIRPANREIRRPIENPIREVRGNCHWLKWCDGFKRTKRTRAYQDCLRTDSVLARFDMEDIAVFLNGQ
jgi:hypothetical protein